MNIEKLIEAVHQILCDHPLGARETMFSLFPEENGFEIYEKCLNCGKEFPEMRIN